MTSTSNIPEWVDNLTVNFVNHHHMDSRAESVRTFMWSPQGCRIIAQWLKNQDFKVEYWELDYVVPGREPGYPIAYGIEFDDACPQIVECKLKSLK